ncbi:hypothetical protein C3L33_18932, partial [Rhododendron williamsianum]
MDVPPLLIFSLFFFFLISPPCLIHAQQPYVGKATTACGTTGNSNTVVGYTCNGLNTACQAYITFRSQSPYNTVSSVSQLLNSDPSRVSRINSVPDYSSIIDTDELVVVPVKCSCSGGRYYQSNTHYVVQQDDTYFSIANNTFQGLSTCQALQAQNSAPATSLSIGTSVPLRCACPTKNRSDNGVKYLLCYFVTRNRDVSDISTIFGVDYRSTPEANELFIGCKEENMLHKWVRALANLV